MITQDNVVTALRHVQTEKGVKYARIKEFCVSFVLRHYQDILSQQNFETLEPSLLVEIMRLHQQYTTSKAFKVQLSQVKHIEVPANKLAEDLAQLRSEEKSYDFFFHVRDKIIGAHLIILAARTGFFQGAIRSMMKEVQSRQVCNVI